MDPSDKTLLIQLAQTLLSWPVIVGLLVVCFFRKFHDAIDHFVRHVTKLSAFGGTVEAAPLAQAVADPEPAPAAIRTTAAPGALAEDRPLTAEEKGKILLLFQSAEQIAATWEFRFLNYYFVITTQAVLDWVVQSGGRQTLDAFDASFSQVVVKERKAIIDALESHRLIAVDGAFIEVTKKGRDYWSWPGRMVATTPNTEPQRALFAAREQMKTVAATVATAASFDAKVIRANPETAPGKAPLSTES